jgi:hypothetical protein
MPNVSNEMMLFLGRKLTLSVANGSWGIFGGQAISSQALKGKQKHRRFQVYLGLNV